MLKKLTDAERDGNPIYGVIRGTAENHGGRANTLTSPNPKLQADLLVKAICQFLQHQNSRPFSSDIPVGIFGEGFAFSVFAEHACFAVADMRFFRQNRIDSPGNRHVAFSVFYSG
jgi:hypothetical protein